MQHCFKKGFIILPLLVSLQLFAQPYQPNWESLNTRPVPDWYRDAKFGIFIHWGIYSVPAWATNSNADGPGSGYAEWYWQRLNATNLKIHKEFTDFHEKTYGSNFSYPDFAKNFKAELFNPEQWVSVFKNAGAKYVVLTSKHHDGFCLWPSPQSWNWNAVDIGPKRDLVNDLTVALRKGGIHAGYYYSLYEWYNPLYKTDINKYVEERMLPQMKDLVTKYKPDILWTDGEWEKTSAVWKSKEFLSWLYNESPVKDAIVVNDRWGSDSRGNFTSCIQTSEYGSGTIKENAVWEETRGIGQSFGYNRNENLEQYASSKDLVHQLIKIVSGGGNLLLNIGPNADGSIPVIMQQRLKDIGDWLKVNGESIYNTRPLSNKIVTTDSSIYFTSKNKSVYAIATKWKNSIVITNVEKPVRVSLIGYNKKLNFTYKDKKLIITAPALTPDINPSQYAWVYKIEY
jgi:alpha-L-fucosidase